MSRGPLLCLEPRASPVLTLLTVAVHAMAAAAVLAAFPGAPGLCAAGLLAVLAAVVTRERTLLRAARSPAAVELWEAGSLVVRLREGGELRGRAAPRRYVSRWLVVLELVLPEGGRCTIVLAGDMFAAEDFRRLRLWALWNALPAPLGATGA